MFRRSALLLPRRASARRVRRSFSSNFLAPESLVQRAASRALPERFAIVDSTLREGEQFMVCTTNICIHLHMC
jgi:hypothetical protein